MLYSSSSVFTFLSNYNAARNGESINRFRGNRLYDIRKLRADVFGKIRPSSGKGVNGSALPPRLTDWKGNPFAIRSVLIRSDSRHTCIRFGFPASRPVALSSLAISSVAGYLLRKYSRRSFNTLTQTNDARDAVQQKRRFLEREIAT